jgi:hypothetical protein
VNDDDDDDDGPRFSFLVFLSLISNFWLLFFLALHILSLFTFFCIHLKKGGLGTIALYFSCCFPQHFTNDTWRSLALKFSVMVTISQGLTLLIFKSTACTDNNIIQALEESVDGVDMYSNTCEWDKGSSINVSAILCWFATGVSMILIGPPAPAAGAAPRRSKKKQKSKKKKSAAAAAATTTSAKDDKDAVEAGATPEAVTTE